MTAANQLSGPPLTRATALRILSDLKLGKPPHEHVRVIHVGYEALLEHFGEKLEELSECGTSDVKFINADYGRGKSHFLDLIRLLAFERGFVVSRVELNQKDVPFDKLEIVIKKIIANASTFDFRDNGFEKTLRKWARDNRGKSQSAVFEQLKDLEMPALRVNLVNFLRACNANPPDEFGIAEQLKWFRGEQTKSKTFSSVQQYLHALTQFFRLLGYSGFVIMLDEAEAISSLTRGTRGEVANENIRQIIDNTQGTEGFYFVFASTPTFFEAPPGGIVRPGDPVSIYSYPALRRRVENILDLMDPTSPESVIVAIPDLTEEDFLSLARKIRDLFFVAYGEAATPVTDQELGSLVRYIRSNDPRVATLVRSVYAVCEQARRPGFSFDQRFEVIVEHERELVDRQASERTA